MPTLADEIMAGRNLTQVRFRDDNRTVALGPALASSGTIPTWNLNYYRFSTAGAVTGIIMQKGQYDGQLMIVANSSANSATFATSATSNVADGTNVVIPATRAGLFIYSVVDALWYAVESTT